MKKIRSSSWLLLFVLIAFAGALALVGCGPAPVAELGLVQLEGSEAPPASNSLVFPKDAYGVETKTVETGAGKVEVTYRLYKHLQYVTMPVDKDYQSLNVSVPVKINGVDVDSSNAPILFDIAVGGYMSSSNAEGAPAGPPAGLPGIGGPGGPLGPPPAGPTVSNADYALAAGFVVVSPGCRGWDCVTPNGIFYGKAPAAIVDLKCAVKYVLFNAGRIPGNTDLIISTGGSAGGALSALLGASGDSDIYDQYFAQLGAANASDAIFASACYCPITDLEHADMAYEWMYGALPAGFGPVDPVLSKQLKDAFRTYQASLGLQGLGTFGEVRADNYADYLLQTYLVPAANRYLRAMPTAARAGYLAQNPWITWTNNSATFSFADYVAHVTRMKGLPAFDTFDNSMPENKLFGSTTVDARHFTNFALQHTSGNYAVEINSRLAMVVNLMNPMYFLAAKNPGCVNYWWIRHGTIDNHTSLTVIANLALAAQNLGKKVDSAMYWDAPHGANEDPDAFVSWVKTITGYKR